MKYTVKQLAQLAGVSVRTLHHYDQIGLLKPAEVKANGYRQYGEQELLKLQQILFFRELEFSLDEIQRIINSPNFHLESALMDQRKMIELRKKRLNALIRTIDKTLQKLNLHTPMKDGELYDAFSDEQTKQYADEAKQRWGHTDAYKESQERVSKMTKGEMAEIQAANENLILRLVSKMHLDPADGEVQALVAEHFNALKYFYEPNLEMYSGMANMYVDDERFKAYYDKFQPSLAEFLSQGMKVYCQEDAK